MSKQGAVMLSLIFLGLAGATAWRFQTKKADDDQLKKSQAARVKAAPIVVLASATPKKITDTIDVVGSVESPFNVKLSPKVAGRINFLEAREGTEVKAGQVLVRIDPGDLKAAVLQQESAVAEARSRLAQARATQGTTDVSVVSGIEQQRASVSSANADYNQTSNNYASQVASAQSAVVDAESRVRTANSQVESAKSDVASAQANLENAQAKYNRILSLYKDGFIAAQDVDDSRTVVAIQQSALSSAKSKLLGAQSGVESAKAQLVSAQNQASIVAKKGRSDIEAAKARAQQAQSSLKLANSNRTQSQAYKDNLSALSASVAVAEAQLEQARSRINDTTIASTIDGTVTSRMMDEGSFATAGQPILNIQFLKWMYVSANVPIEQGQFVKIGTPVTISFDSLPGEVVNSQIAEINPAADPQSRQFLVRVKLDNTNRRLRTGMFAHMSILIRETQAEVTVPRDAVKTKGGKTTVFYVDDKKVAHLRDVTIGASSSNDYQITNGLNSGDKVVILTYQNLKDGQTVSEGPPKDKGEGKDKGQGKTK